MFIAMFVVAGTLSLSIQQREREIALLRAVAATPGQIRRMIAWEAAIIALIGSAAGIWPGIVLGRTLAHGLVRHGIAPPNFTLNYDWLPAAAVIGCAVATALLAVLAAGRRAAHVPPTLALTDAAVEPRLLGPGRIIGGLLALAGAVPLFTVAVTTSTPETAAATAEMTAILLVVAVGFLGPIFAYVLARLLAPALAALSPVGGFLASSNLARRHPTVLLGQHAVGAQRRDELHASVQHHHHRARHHPAKTRRADRPARPHHHRSGTAHRGAERRARHPRSALGRRAHLDHARPQPGRLRRHPPRPDPRRRAGRRPRRRRDRRVAERAARQQHRARAPPRRRRPRPHRRPRGRHARRRHPHPRHRRRRSTIAIWRSATPCSPPSSPPATKPSRCKGRSSSRQTAPPRSPGASRHSVRGIPDSGSAAAHHWPPPPTPTAR